MADSTTDQALTSFNGLLKEMDPAGAEDIQAYRTWMEKRSPIDFTETRFLERKNDRNLACPGPRIPSLGFCNCSELAGATGCYRAYRSRRGQAGHIDA
jgi:hypothetical protein